jgi:hypothetical protein
MPITTEFLGDFTAVLAKHNVDLEELRASFYPAALSPPPAPAPAPKSDVDAAWVKTSAEAILKANIKLTPNAQSFVAQTFARANQYPTVKFSPKQWEWFNKLMLDAGVEAIELPS